MRLDPRLTALFEPESVAVIGASTNPQKIGHVILANLIRARYRGKLFPVNPKGGEILNLPVFSCLADIREPVDLAVICLPRDKVLAAAREVAAKGVPAAVVISAGFKELGREGYLLEQELSKIARNAGIALLGPNSLGLFNARLGLHASFAAEAPRPGSIAFFSQSGALCAAILDWAACENIGFSKFVSLGNEAVLDERHMLAALEQDPDTTVILGYCETVEDGQGFRRIAESVTARKPVIMIKAGSTAAGARAASAHTGALAGSPQACKAAFRQSGIIEVLGVRDLFTLARAFATQPLPRGPNLAVVTNSGGPGILAADACEKSQLTLVRPSPATIERLKAFLPAYASLYNPIDIIGDADSKRFALTVQAVADDPLVNAILVLLTPTASAEPENTARAVIEVAKNCHKPVFACFMGERRVGPGRDLLINAGVPCYAFPEPVIAAIEAMYGHYLWRHRQKPVEICFLRDKDKARDILAKARRQGVTELVEFKAQGLAAAYGLPMPRTILARTSGDAVRAAKQIGWPVALKVASPSIAHKSEQGGVALNLGSPDEVRRAFFAITSRIMRLNKDDYILGCLVQAMAPKDSKEVILGFRHDPQFGPLLHFGLAGVHVDVLQDLAYRLAPLTASDAQEMLREVKALPLLRGFRGEPAVNLAALEDILLSLSQMAMDFPEILEAQLDPVLVNQDGALVADVRLTIG